MNLIRSMFIGAAAGAVVAYFLKRNDGKLMKELSDSYSNGLKEFSHNFKNNVDGADKYVRDRIERVSSN